MNSSFSGRCLPGRCKTRRLADSDVLADLHEDLARANQRLNEPSLSPARRQAAITRKKEIETEIRQAQVGGTIDHWSRIVGYERPELAEILDATSGVAHRAVTWNQGKWESNLRRLQDSVVPLLGRELARPANRQINLQAIGLAEIAYPGLDALPAPAGSAGCPESGGSRGS